MTDEELAARYWAAGLPARFAGWDFATHPRKDWVHRSMYTWAAKVNPPVPGIVLCGAPGTGKTGLMVSALQELILRTPKAEWGELLAPGYRVSVARGQTLRRPGTIFFQPFSALFVRDNADQWVAALEQVDTLGLDDADVINMTAWREGMLKRLVERVNEGKRTILTLNNEPQHLVGALGERVVDRLCERSLWAVFHLKGSSLRQEQRQ